MKNTYKKGDIILIKFPFTNKVDFKVRPALIIRDHDDDDIIVLPISTTINLKKIDIIIKKENYTKNALSINSAIRISKITAIDSKLTIKKISSVKMEFLERVYNSLNRYLFQ